MSAVNIIIETRSGEVQDILSDAPANVAFIDREKLDPEAPNYIDGILGAPAMVSATYEANVVPDDISAHWARMQSMDLPEDTGMFVSDDVEVDVDEISD